MSMPKGSVAAESFCLLLSRVALAQGQGDTIEQTLYQVKTDLLHDYLRAELQNPRVPTLQPAYVKILICLLRASQISFYMWSSIK